MRSRKTQAIPARLEAGRRRFEQWRRTRQGHSRIPERLWTSAVRLAGAYGLCKTARTLGLDYNALKKRIHAADPHEQTVVGQKMVSAKTARQVVTGQPLTVGPASAMAFVELVPSGPTCSSECIVELEDLRGAKMRIQVKGAGVPDLAALSRSFWGIEA